MEVCAVPWQAGRPRTTRTFGRSPRISTGTQARRNNSQNAHRKRMNRKHELMMRGEEWRSEMIRIQSNLGELHLRLR